MNRLVAGLINLDRPLSLFYRYTMTVELCNPQEDSEGRDLCCCCRRNNSGAGERGGGGGIGSRGVGGSGCGPRTEQRNLPDAQKIFNEFCDASTIHGLKYLGTRPLYEK